MKLSRLLATLTLIVGVLAVPAPAAAGGEPDRSLTPETVRGICTTFAGTYVGDRLSYGCELRGGTIHCGETCAFHTITGLAVQPPLMQDCVLVRGTLLHLTPAEIACQLRDGEFGVSCPGRPGLTSVICELRWIAPSEQPMDD